MTAQRRRGLARAVVGHRKTVVAAWVVVFAALAPFAGSAERDLEVAARVRGSESGRVERALRERFHSPFASTVTIVATGVPGPTDSTGRTVLRDVIRAVSAVPGVTGTLSFLDVPDSLFLGGGGRAGSLIVVGLEPGSSGSLDALIPPLRAATEGLLPDLRRRWPDAALRWTGEIAINYDLRRTSATDVSVAEQRVLPLTLVALLIAFRTIVAAVLPVIAGVLAISATLGLAVLVGRLWPLSILLQNTVSMIGLGVGIDYALLTVSRFREAMAGGLAPMEAAEEAASHAGATIAISGVAVMIGFGALIVIPLNELQSIGVGGVIVVGVSILLAATLLPALLAMLGLRVEAGRLWHRSSASTDRWNAWGRFVGRHPVAMLTVSALPLLLLANEGRRIQADIPRGNWLPAEMESARGLADLEAMGRSGVINTVRVLLELPQGVTAPDSASMDAVGWLTATLATDSLAARVRSLSLPAPSIAITTATVSRIPQALRRTLMSDDGRLLLVEVIPHDADFTAVTALARRLRELNPEEATGISGASLSVGGLPAFNADYIDAVHRSSLMVVLLVIGTTLVSLMVAFRSVLVPLKAVLLNLLSVAGAFGAVVLVFQDGHFLHLLGVEAPLDGVFPAVPILVFCIVFGLSMDYEIFLVSRVAEARRSGLSDSDAIAEALGKTGGVITSAALIMIVVFAAFTLGHFLLTKILGFALAIAVLLDATLVRMIVGPALLRLAGRWNWWPSK